MTAITQQPVKLRGELVAWKAVPGKDGWGFGTLAPVGKKASAASESAKVTGTLVGVRVGDCVDLTGVWTDGPYGRQFKVRECTVVRAEGADGAVKWMASRFPGIGGVRAIELSKRFGDDLWKVIEHEPERLAEINGITLDLAQKIQATYREVAHEREHMTKLRGWGLTDGQVSRCKEQWGSLEKVINKLVANPYLLCQHVYGFGFVRADEIALRMGTPRTAPERIRAGIEYQLDEAAGEGHCFVWGGKLQSMSAEMLGVDAGLVVTGIKSAVINGRVMRRGARVYTRRMDSAERALAEGLSKLLDVRAHSAGEKAA